VLAAWRRAALGLPEKPEAKGPYDLVVVGGGYSGMGAAIAAARMGLIKRGRYSLIGEIVDEFADKAKKSPGTAEEFPDGCVPSTWSIDLHYPKEEYAPKFPDNNPFISIAVHDNRIDRNYGYPVPYRCFYS
jgi:cation diffusion facilitator CzcD-associated flavoprotein CzcO